MFFVLRMPFLFCGFSGFPLSTGTLGVDFPDFRAPGGSFWGVPNQNAASFGREGSENGFRERFFDFWTVWEQNPGSGERNLGSRRGFGRIFPDLAVFREHFPISAPIFQVPGRIST